jgi:hypothetical protein
MILQEIATVPKLVKEKKENKRKNTQICPRNETAMPRKFRQ